MTMKFLTAAAALTPMLVKSTRSYGLQSWRRPMVVWNPYSSLLRDEAWLKPTTSFPQSVSPKYEITDTNEKFQIAIDVPGVKAEDINVSLENDGQVLTLSGEREEKKENYQYSSKFYQSFSLDPAIITEDFTANLKDGVLIVSAPKDFKKVEEAVQKIPITEHEHPKEDIPINKKDEEIIPINKEEVAETKEAQTA